MSYRTSPSRTFQLRLANGRLLYVAPVIAGRVRGVDADGDVLVCDEDIKRADGTERLVPLTPCCHATGKGASYSETNVACRHCCQDVGPKYGTDGHLAVGLAATVASVSVERQPGEVLTFSATATDGPTSLALVGSSGSTNELRERLWAATANSGLPVIHRSITVRVDPHRKLPPVTSAAIAVAAIAAAAGISTRRITDTAVIGDVSLDGGLRTTGDIYAAVRAARAHGISRVIVPATCLEEIVELDDLEVLGAHRLAEIAEWLRGDDNALHNLTSDKPNSPTRSVPDQE
ncbi:magnesium chelatase domain-containing protein [Lentzea sp. BCCO 10_0061]|uniref:Magnesium chelatase domain-containing protein n=1 Tax=Lentzea sokolovensis TaxID=3095429 RepID=A0ABU4UM43_9PSEU|nr:magnesium chelatase domain-containing protein [Lentzea sp. BCCO 10_0061]MDX8140561.1 magnesium chelatase domain-containing protein [Lentzea sp. BCCO 10_0061]